MKRKTSLFGRFFFDPLTTTEPISAVEAGGKERATQAYHRYVEEAPTLPTNLYGRRRLRYPLQQPGHVLAQYPHRADPLLVLLHIPFAAADTHIPVIRTRDDHLADGEEVVDAVEDVDGAGPAHRHHR